MPKVKLNLAGFRQVRQSPRMLSELNVEAERIADRANALATSECSHPEHARFKALNPILTKPGAVALVTTGGDPGCMGHNAKHNTLLKAVKQQ